MSTWTATKYEKRNGALYPPKLLFNGVAVLVLHRARAERPKGNGHLTLLTERQATALVKRIVAALNATEKS